MEFMWRIKGAFGGTYYQFGDNLRLYGRLQKLMLSFKLYERYVILTVGL